MVKFSLALILFLITPFLNADSSNAPDAAMQAKTFLPKPTSSPTPDPSKDVNNIQEDENLTVGVKLAIGASQLSNLGPSNNLSPRQILVDGYGQVSTVGGGSIACGFGLSVGGGYRHYISIKQELWWIGRNVEQPDYPGAGLAQSTIFFREVLEAPALIELGWPGAMGVKFLRPFVYGGLYGERILNTPFRSRNLGTDHASSSRWIGTPNEDWGYVLGVGLKYKIWRLEWRYEEGQNDLDPMGMQPLFARNSYLVFVLGE